MSQFHQPTQDELDSSCFHHKDKNCRIVWYPIPKKEEDKQIRDEDGKRVFVNIVACKTHTTLLCYAEKNCFWQVGAHYGELSQGIDSNYSLDDYPIDEANENPIESLT